MEIVYDEGYNVRFRLDDGREFALADLLVDLERLEKVDGAMSLVANSREWNRKRVIELEDKLERYHRAHVCTSSCQDNAHVAFTGKGLVRDLEAQVAKLTEQVKGYDHDRKTERDRADRNQARAIKAEELVQEERIRGNNLAQRLAQSEQRERELEAQNQRLTEYANAQEARHAEENEQYRQSIAARDSLLQGAAATVRRIQTVVWTTDMDRLIENRGVPAVVHELADLSAAAISRIRAFTGQPA